MARTKLEQDEHGNLISDPSTVAKIINSFLNEIEIALIKDVQLFKDNDSISEEVYNAFISRNMQRLDELYQEDLDAYRNAEIVLAADVQRGASKQAIPKWNGKHFKKKLINRDFVNSNRIAKQTPPVLLLGSPGIGKSDIVRSIANERGYGPAGLLDIRLSQKEAIDLRGFPVPNKNTRSVDWFISSEWPRNPLSRGILFLDELTSAPKSVQVGAYELILDRKLGDIEMGGYELPPGWFICSAGNLATDGAAVEDVSSALANRLLHIVMHVSVENWIAWAIKSSIHPCVISFMTVDSVMGGLPNTYKLHNMNAVANKMDKKTGTVLPVVNTQQGWPSPRSWARVSTVLYTYEAMLGYQKKIESSIPPANKYANFKDIVDPKLTDIKPGFVSPQYLKNNLMDQEALKDMIVGLIGFETGREFYSFYQDYSDAIMTITDILLKEPLRAKSEIAVMVGGQQKNMTAGDLTDKIKKMLQPGTSAEERVRLGNEIGAHPLVFLQTSPDVLQSKMFFNDHIKRLGDKKARQTKYEQAIENILTFVELLTDQGRQVTANVQNVKTLLLSMFNSILSAGIKKSSSPDDIQRFTALTDACLDKNKDIQRVLTGRNETQQRIMNTSLHSSLQKEKAQSAESAISIFGNRFTNANEGTKSRSLEPNSKANNIAKANNVNASVKANSNKANKTNKNSNTSEVDGDI